jgi:stage V sporulation protein G
MNYQEHNMDIYLDMFTYMWYALYTKTLTTGGAEMDEIITEVRVFPKENLGKTLGFANITILDKFVVKNLRIVQGDKGIFIGMPSNKRKNGEFIDLFFPITQDARDLITNAILVKYQEVARDQSQTSQVS